ncbi:MAG TPA: hypothetical protein VFH88_10635 [Candidatus Krumholzibacteria bacterium]|nr:hypothetical protein [Candidatus Krumholzibacteria bacterium]
MFRLRVTIRVAFALLTACVIAAIVVQDHTRYLPLGVFNTGARTMAHLADACLVAACLVLLAQITELTSGRLARLCGVIRGLYVSVIILDVLLIFADRVFVTGDPNGRLGQYYEVPHSGNPPVILKKDFGGHHSQLPCFAAANDSGPRVLFLGDSYTEGSGSNSDCNYVDVAARVLREKWRPDVKVINAGVSGYGPVEALSLLRWYKENGCPAQVIVYNMTLENDLSDNLPGTERRVVAGIIFRFPKNGFLRTFHPLNTRIFRWALVIVYFGRASTHDMLQAVSVPGGPCDLTPRPLTEVPPFLRATVERDLANAQRMWVPIVAGKPFTVKDVPVFKEPMQALAEMRRVANEMGARFFVVVFPDRILVDRELQALLGNPPLTDTGNKYEFSLRLTWREIGMRDVLSDRPGLYRPVDTHLSDLGNVVAGETVAGRITWYLTHRTID